MSGMADEMARRMADENGGQIDDPALGNGTGSQAGAAAQSAGTSNTDTAAAGGAPDTIPYARFKEVNDQLAPYKQLGEFGYDADSLRRLVSFEQEYLRDPSSTVLNLATNLDLPDELKEQITNFLSGNSTDGSAGSSSAQGASSDEGKTAELPPDVQKRLEYVDTLQEREAQAERDAQLQRVVDAWKGADKQDGIETPEYLIYAQIAAAASNGRFNTVEELASAARSPLMDYRSSTLGSAVQTGRREPPASLPNGGSQGAGPIKFSDLRSASKAAEQAMLRGELPGLKEG